LAVSYPKLMFPLAASLFTAVAITAPPAPSIIRVGLDPRTAPWAFVPGYDDSKEDFRAAPRMSSEQLARLTGLDVEVMRILAREMGASVEIVPTPWIDLESGLRANRFDMILDAWTPSTATSPDIVASDPYYTWSLLVVVRSSDTSIRSVADLAGRRVGHVSDPSVLRAVRAMGLGLGAELERVDQGGPAMFDLLATSDLDAVIFDSTFVRWRIARDTAFRILGEPLNLLGYHVGVRRADPDLLARVQTAVRSFVKSSEATALRRKWEGPEAPRQ
jgi:ABC-type amino acid transport substrate-binding protein